MPVTLIRGSGIQASSASSFNVSWPAGTVAGDFAVICAAGGFNPGTPTGWAVVDSQTGSWNGKILTKTLNSSDITAGHVTITFGGTFDAVTSIVTFQGDCSISAEAFTLTTTGGSQSPPSVTVDPGDVALYFSTIKASSTCTVNRGTLLQQADDGVSAAGCVYFETVSTSQSVSPIMEFTALGISYQGNLVVSAKDTSGLGLLCACVGDFVCTVTAMFINVTYFNIVGPNAPTVLTINLVDPVVPTSLPVPFPFPSAGNTVTVGIVGAHWLTNWASLYLELDIDASLFQVPCNNIGYTLSLNYNIETHLHCVDILHGTSTDQVIFSVDTSLKKSKCITGSDIRSVCVGGGGAANLTLFCSTPLGACNGCDIQLGNFKPDPNDSLADNLGNGCVCASGGTPPYTFTIIDGQLPCGQSLDPTTGCITGTPDGTCTGTATIEIQVMDSQGNNKSVTCNINNKCTTGRKPRNTFY